MSTQLTRAQQEAVQAVERAREHVMRELVSLSRLAREDPDHDGAFFANELSRTCRRLSAEAVRIARIRRDED